MADVIVIQGDSDEETVVIYSSGVPVGSFILLESGDYLLQEDNSKFKLETSL